MALESLKDVVQRLGLKERVRACEDWWFDAVRGVRTSGDAAAPVAAGVVGEIRDSHIYAPVRVANAHAALRDLPIGGSHGRDSHGSSNGGDSHGNSNADSRGTDYSEYTFVDMGSGKGRMLFVAAEYPFRKVIGVEFSNDLHEEAVANIRQYRHRKRRCGDIESVHADAAEFEFPDENLVVYLFNPFGPEVMGRMLANLERSIERHPRHVVVVMLWPEHSDLVARMRGVRVYRKTRRHHIYEAGVRP